MLTMLKIYYNFNFSIYSNFLMAHLNSYANVATLFANIDSIKKYPEFTEVCEFIRYADWNSFTLRNVSISGKECLKSSGSNTQGTQGGQGLRIPSCFGIIAIQLLAASSRHDDESHTANAYNPRLANLLGIKENNLQQKYSSAQKEIYRVFKIWCEENNFIITFSDTKGKYVCYPLSLALLHRKDLDSLHYCFASGNFQPKNEIFFDDFQKNFSHLLGIIEQIAPAVARKYERAEDWRKKAIVKQIYTELLNWDGTYASPNDKKQSRIEKHPVLQEYSLYWVKFANQSPEFYCNENIAAIPYCGLYSQDPSNCYKWNFLPNSQLSRQLKQPCIWVFTTDDATSLFLKKSGMKICSFDNCKICELTADIIARMLQEFHDDFGGRAALRLTGGIRLGIRNWMEGAGPIIENDNLPNDFAWLFCEGRPQEKISISAQELQHYPAGEYTLRYHPDAPPIYFKISPPCECKDRLSFGGWLFKDGFFQPGEDSEIHCHALDFGKLPLDLFSLQDDGEANPIQDWMMLATGQKISQHPTESVLHKILRRSHSGIRNW